MGGVDSQLDPQLDPERVRARLGLPEQALDWLRRVGELSPTDDPVLPTDTEAGTLLERLAVNPRDRAETLAARPDPAAHPELWWVLERAYRDLVADMGGTKMLRWPHMPAGTGAVGRHLYVWVFLAAAPAVRRYHAEREVPDQVSWASLADLGQQMSVYRRIFHTGGLHTQWWLTLPFRGALYELGRLQFNRGTVWFEHAPAPPGVTAPRPGDRAIGLHIPERGTMDPDACTESIARAREFFPRHFPEEPVSYGVCTSWLLDPQLEEYLPESSNIVRFLRRFHLVPHQPQDAEWTPGDRSILEFVFRRMHDGPDFPAALVDELPQNSTLQRAIVSHWRAGGHWHARIGWFPLTAS